MKLVLVLVLTCASLQLCNSLMFSAVGRFILKQIGLYIGTQLQETCFLCLLGNALLNGTAIVQDDSEPYPNDHHAPIYDPHVHSVQYSSSPHSKPSYDKIHKIIGHYTNNACHHPEDFDSIADNENCWYNPEADLTVPQIIQKNGYPLEIHPVTTEDGYYLQLFRIPFGRYNTSTQNATNKRPVFLQHGIFASSAPWVIVGNKSLGFILAEKGYDVWLGNSRGSTYSKGHMNYSTYNPKYWDWSWSEMGMYDLPASLDVVIRVNGRSDVIYIGQSLGTNLPYVYGTMQPEEATKRISLIINLAPTLFLGHIKTKYRVFTHYLDKVAHLAHKRGSYEFLPQTKEFKAFWEKKCLHSKKGYYFCVNLLFDLFGEDYEQFRPESLTLIISHFPAGSSVKNFIHLGQSVISDHFAPYDYGEYENILRYTTRHPPSYNLTRMTIPSFVMYGENDYTAPDYGAKLMYHKLPNQTRAGLYRVKYHHFNHVDFVFAKDIVHLVYNKMLRVMGKY